jgi:hypothetical protein
MKKIVEPTCSVSELFDECVQGISNAGVRNRLIAQKGLVADANADYAACSLDQTWCQLPKAAHGHPEQVIVGNLTKGELVDLYTTGMVKSQGGARTKYDQIKILAREECPYCGGCGEFVDDEGVGTLDHFLPKARFPAFSILPGNLVPACGTCNTGMGSSFPTDPNLQPLHPYFDAPHFFEEKWTTVTVSEQDPVMVTFDLDVPAEWSHKDSQRVSQHFKVCKLRGRYRAKAASDVSSLIDQRKTVHRELSPNDFREILKVVADNKALPINGWKRTLHHGLAESAWFCSHDFAD